MQVPLVMTVMGQDRPGLVELIADLIARHGGNWLESRMCRLGGEFAGILKVHVESGRQQELQQQLRDLQAQGLTVTVCSTRPDSTESTGKMALLELVGQDRPGIVREISRALARQGVNVEELETECSSAPMSGEMLFKATARLRIPDTCPLPALREELEQIGGNLLVDVSVQEVT